MASVLASSAVDRRFEPRSGQTKNYEIGICCFSALRCKSKYWLTRNQENVSEWSDLSIRGLLFQWASTTQIKRNVLVEYKAGLINISFKINLFSPWYTWKIAELAFNNNHSLSYFSVGVFWPLPWIKLIETFCKRLLFHFILQLSNSPTHPIHSTVMNFRIQITPLLIVKTQTDYDYLSKTFPILYSHNST